MSDDALDFSMQIEALLGKVAIGDFAKRLFRTIAPSIIILLSLGAFAPLFEYLFSPRFGENGQKANLFGLFVSISFWLFALVVLWQRLLKLRAPSHAKVRARADEILAQADQPPIGVILNKKANGDDSIWDLLRANISNEKLADIKTLPKLEFQDWFLFLGLLTTALLCMINPSQSIKSIGVNFSPLVGDYALETIAWATPPAYIGGAALDISTTSGTIELPKESIIEVRSFGSTHAPSLKIGNYNENLRKIGERRFAQRIVVHKSGTLVLSRFGTKQKWHIKIREDRPPKIRRSINIENLGSGKIALGFRASDDYKITKAALILEERPWFNLPEFIRPKLHSIHMFDASLISQDDTSHFEIDVSSSVLVGMRANAYLVLEDSAGQRTASKAIALGVESPPLTTNIAQALQELRLKLLRTRKNYRPQADFFGKAFNPNNDARIDIGRPAMNAPPQIAAVYRAISALLIAPEQMGIDENSRLGLVYAQVQLAHANNLESAKLASDILWDLVVRNNQNPPQDTKSRIAQAVSALKQALQSGASEGEIAELRGELGQAISDHIDALQSQSPEAGDMEVEGHDTMNAETIGETIDEAQSLAKTGDVDAANQKLDELQRQLENLSGVEASGDQGVGQSGQNQGMNATDIDELLREQRALNDDAQRGTADNQALAARQEALRQKLPPAGQSGDSNLQEADSAMREATQKLQAGQKNEALSAQSRALSALQNYSNSLSSDSSADPLGRPNSPTGGQDEAASGAGESRSNKEKIPKGNEQARARNIFERLRERLEKNQKDDEQRRYLEELLRRQ